MAPDGRRFRQVERMGRYTVRGLIRADGHGEQVRRDVADEPLHEVMPAAENENAVAAHATTASLCVARRFSRFGRGFGGVARLHRAPTRRGVGSWARAPLGC